MAPAEAQVIYVSPQTISRKLPFRPDDEHPFWFSYDDCVQDDEITMNVALSGPFIGNRLQVWVGTSITGSNIDCNDRLQRVGPVPQCWLVFDLAPTLMAIPVTMRIRDIVGRHLYDENPNGPGSGTLADCNYTGDPPLGIPVSLYFMLVDANSNEVCTPSKYDTKIDLLGPPAPTNVSVTPGDRRLTVHFTPPLSTELGGFDLICAAATDQTGGCASDSLSPGVRPDRSQVCGTVGKSETSGDVALLVDGTSYAVGVSALDKTDNLGPLSSVQCATPRTHIESHSNASCAYRANRQRHPWPAIFALIVAGAIRVRCRGSLCRDRSHLSA